MAQLLYIVGASLVALTTAQSISPYSICSWREPRGGVVRDTWYIEGGIENIKVSSDQSCKSSASPYGGLFKLNFSTPFDITSSNVTNLFVAVNETIDPSSVPYVNGFLIAGNNEWYSFGGQAYPQANKYAVNSGIVRNALYQPRPDANPPLGFTPNYQATSGNLSSTSTTYITNGAGVSVPSESLGFYFSGLRANATNQNLSYYPVTANDRPSTLVSSMMKVDISLFGAASWNTIPLPDSVAARAEASMVWIPAGPKGALVIIGGITIPADIGESGYYLTPGNETIANSTGPGFVSNVTIYDVATGRWYTQLASGGPPPQIAQACAVAATAQDGVTHSVYLYGGYNGVDGNTAYDDVWVLSIPSFTWIKAASGSSSHARLGHVCAKPYPDQMMIVGGVSKGGNVLSSSVIDVFNLNTLKWTGKYDPSVYSNYSVPSVVSDAIKASPTAASMDNGLASLLQSAYPSPTTAWYPYVRSSDPNVTPPTESHSNTTVIAIAVVVPVVVLTLAGLLGWFLYRRHQKKKAASSSPSENTRISSWINGQNPPENSTHRSDDEMTQVSNATPGPYEVHGTYFKPVPQATVAELHSNHSENNSTQHSPLGSPRGGPDRSPPSSSAELPSDETRYELPGDSVPGLVPLSHPLRGHHLYPASVDGHVSSVRSPSSVSSPSTNPISDDDLPSSASRAGSNEGLSIPDNDMLNLGYSNSRRSASSYRYSKLTNDPRSPLDRLSPLDEDHHGFSSLRSDVSPALSPVRETAPQTPPMQAIGANSAAQNQHTRNNSSLDSGLATLPSPGPHEDQRQSMTLAALPNSPERPASSRSDNPGQVSTASAIPVRRVSPQDIGSWQRPKQSAYEENDDMYGNSKRA